MDFQTYVRQLNRTSKRKIVMESASEGEDEEEDDVDDFDVDEHDDGRHYVKEEGARRQYYPQRGNRRNNPRCDRCTRRNDLCYAQDLSKARGACFECGKGKQKCIFSVRNYTIVSIQYY
jgi:hypothetical protein